MQSNIFHFTPKDSWMNDPNGLVYYQGEYHLFYQHNPNDLVWGPMHWGHAVSEDFIHWEHLPIALFPDELGTIFSGSVVIDWDDSSGFFNGNSGLVAIFTHCKLENQEQSIAYSIDNGRTWIKYIDNPVIKNPGKKDFRDPRVFFYKPSKKWIALIACGISICFYSSLDLKEWSFESEFKDADMEIKTPWECPDLFELEINGTDGDKKWVLKIDFGDGAVAGGSGGIYYTGDFDGKIFSVDVLEVKHKWIDYSQDFYASQTWNGTFETQNRVVWIAWMNNWLYANKIPATSFRGMMTLPRELELKKLSDELFLIQKPVKEFFELRKEITCQKDIIISSNEPYRLDCDVKAAEIFTEFKCDCDTKFHLKIMFGNSESVLLNFDGESKRVSLDRSMSGSTDFSESFKGKFYTDLIMIKDYLNLRVYIDVNSVEVFINDGVACMSSLIFPKTCMKHVEANSVSDCTILKRFELYDLGDS